MKFLVPLLLVIALPVGATQLIDDDGQAIILCGPGDPEGFLYLGSRQPDGTRIGGNQADILNALADHGGNALYMIAYRYPPGDGTADESPLTCSEDGSTSCNADSDCSGTCELDPDILAQWELWFATMEAQGIWTYFIFLDDGACPEGFDCDDGAVTPFEQYFYGGLVNQFEHHSNIIWIWAEEYTDLGFSTAADEARAVAAFIAAEDDSNAPFGIHTIPGTDFETAHSADADIDFWSMQYSGSDLWPMPAWHNDLESRYTTGDSASSPYSIHIGEVARGGMETGEFLYDQLWAALMAGSGTLVHGWWNDGSCAGNACHPSGPPPSDLNYCRDLLNLVDAVNLADADPDDARAAGSAEYALVDDVRATYLAYSSNYTTSMGITGVAGGTYSLRWLDVNGNTASEQIVHPGGNLDLSAPPAISGTKVSLAIEVSEPDPPIVYVADMSDCDDGDPVSFPAAFELCDGNDNDCNANVPANEIDDDGDLWVDCGAWSDIQNDNPTILGGGDCNDADPAINPGSNDIPGNGIDEDCSGADAVTCYDDGDSDGFGAGTGVVYTNGICVAGSVADNTDCDDADALSFPGASEACDGNDNDCDTTIPADEIDDDGDLYVECAGWSDSQADDPTILGGDDCNDSDAGTFPGSGC